MLIRKDKKLLKKLIKLSRHRVNHNFTFRDDSDNSKIFLLNSDFFINYKGKKDEIFQILNVLADAGYIQFKNEFKTYFLLTYQGVRYFQFCRKEIWETIIKSVVLPIIVSFLTTIAMAVFAYLWTH